MLYNTVPRVYDIVLHTSKFVKVDFMLIFLTTDTKTTTKVKAKRNKETLETE